MVVRRKRAGRGVRDEYADHPEGADGWYRDHGNEYANPHEPAVAAALSFAVATWPGVFAGPILDFCCGSGEVTRSLLGLGYGLPTITACDPYTGEAYARRCGNDALQFSFGDIADGALAARSFSAVVCSYALHLCEESRLAHVCWALRDITSNLVVITPHKRPEIRPSFGWDLDAEHRDGFHRTRLRLYSASKAPLAFGHAAHQ